jgi:hypothetical protein
MDRSGVGVEAAEDMGIDAVGEEKLVAEGCMEAMEDLRSDRGVVAITYNGQYAELLRLIPWHCAEVHQSKLHWPPPYYHNIQASVSSNACGHTHNDKKITITSNWYQ